MGIRDRSDDPSYHERTLYSRSSPGRSCVDIQRDDRQTDRQKEMDECKDERKRQNRQLHPMSFL